MNKNIFARLPTTLVFLSLTGALPGTGHAAPLLQAYALSAGGASAYGSQGPFSCSTFGPDPLAKGVGVGFELRPPAPGCGVGVDSRTISATSGPVSVSSLLAVSFGQSSSPHVFVGTSTGRAGFGNLGVMANATYSGVGSAGIVVGAQAFGIENETMTFGGSTGAGFYRPTFTIDGSLFNLGQTESQFAFHYAVGTGPNFVGFRIQNSRGTITLVDPTGYVAALPGFSVTGDLMTGLTVAGSTTITLNIPIVFGAATDLTYSLWAASLPLTSFGQLTPSTGNVEFLSTVELTGIELFDSAGFALENFTIAAGSGTKYDRNGVVGITDPGGPNGVPEPGTLPLLGLAIFAMGWLRPSHPSKSITPASDTASGAS